MKGSKGLGSMRFFKELARHVFGEAKGLMAFLVVLSILISLPARSEAAWLNVGETSKFVYYVEDISIVKEGNTLIFFEGVHNKNTDTYGMYKIQYNYTSDRFRYLSSAYKKGSNGKVYTDGKVSAWEDLTPNSVFSDVTRRVYNYYFRGDIL